MSKAIRQHWVPRFYLKEFAIPERKNDKVPKVWIFSRHEGDPQIVSINKIAANNYLYSPRDKNNMRSWKMEDKLARLEGAISNIWPSIANSFVDLNNKSIRKGLSLLISTLYLRHVYNIDEVKRIHSQLVEALDAIPKDEKGCPIVCEIEAANGIHEFNNSNWHEYKNANMNDHQHCFVENIETNAIHFAKSLMKKRWSIVFADKPVFITTDRPVTVYNLDKERFGLETKGTIVSVPLSPTRVLVMDDMFDEPASQYYPLGEHGPVPNNYTHWIHAYNFMISHRDPDIVNYEMMAYIDSQEQRGLEN